MPAVASIRGIVFLRQFGEVVCSVAVRHGVGRGAKESDRYHGSISIFMPQLAGVHGPTIGAGPGWRSEIG